MMQKPSSTHRRERVSDAASGGTSRRSLLTGLLAAGVLMTTRALAAKPATQSVIDIAGRSVRIHTPVSRILLGDGTLAYALALLRPDDPFQGVVAWGDNFRAADLDGYRAYQRQFPHIDQIPRFSGKTVDAIGGEQAIALKPDIVVLNLSSAGAATTSGLLRLLEQAGIPVVFVDFRTRMFANTGRSMQILGEVFGRVARAADFLRFRQQQIDRVIQPLKLLTTRPLVMVERAAGLYDDCCLTYGDGNFGELVAVAGGRNLGTQLLPGTFGALSPEKVIHADPDVVLVTGANWSLYSPGGDWVNLGPGADAQEGHARLQRLMQRPAYRTLRAVREQQVYAIWHPFYDNPYYFIALQRVAKWLHPELFAALDPEATFRELHERFLPVPYQSGYWLSLKETVV